MQVLNIERHCAESRGSALALSLKGLCEYPLKPDSRSIEETCRNYSRAWNLPFANKLLRLPREPRGMVYTQIWDEDFMCEGNSPSEDMTRTLQGIPTAFPYILSMQITLRLLLVDTFWVGANPATLLQELSITFQLDGLVVPVTGAVNTELIASSLTSLLKINKKTGFRLKIELCQLRIRLNPCDAHLNMLRPILEGFESEGANIRIFWSHYYSKASPHGGIKHELNNLIKCPSSTYKHNLISILDTDVCIDDEDREHLRENGENYSVFDLYLGYSWDGLDTFNCFECPNWPPY
ncbi:hypothetical protein GQ44DRAFT_756887 [Phaeosphaeriaceae sp. PMI808]|nr:hypothetical protein GQ44DRAFT_756887 [Phaeosphaeriaceae sp. PMI808]